MPEVKLLLDPNPDLTKPQARRRHRPTASRGGKGRGREDLRGGLVAKAVPGVRVAVGKTLSSGNTVSWTRLAGKHFEAGRLVPGAPRRLGTQASAQTRCSSALQSLCVGKGTAQPPESRVRTREEEPRSRAFTTGCSAERSPGVKGPVPGLSAKAGCVAAAVAQRGLALCCVHVAAGSTGRRWEWETRSGARPCRFLAGWTRAA